MVAQIILTDQEYVGKLVKANIEANWREACRHHQGLSQRQGQGSTTSSQKEQRGKGKQLSLRHKSAPAAAAASKGAAQASTSIGDSNAFFMPLDWETDSPELLKQAASSNSSSRQSEDPGFDLVIACDTIYNDALIQPFLDTCADICRLRPTLNQKVTDAKAPSVCLIAQQLRSPEIFTSWLRTALQQFRVWKVDLGEESEGYILHLLTLRDED